MFIGGGHVGILHRGENLFEENYSMKKIQYIDPKIKLVDGVAGWLCGENGSTGLAEVLPSGSKSLAHVLVVVPTAQSGRRLRFALAKRAAEKVGAECCRLSSRWQALFSMGTDPMSRLKR